MRHEGSGVVVAVGPGVTKVKPGDAVILTWIKGEGLDAPGAIYRDGGRTINSGAVTIFSNYTVVAENRVVLKPPALAFDTAVLFGCALPTGAGMVLNELTIPPSASVVILGLGGVGLAVLALGVRNLIAVDISSEKLRTVAGWGVRHGLSAADGEVVARVRELTQGGADVCIESAGRVETIEQGFAMIRKGGGQLLFASHPPDGETIRLAPHDLISGKRIAGSWGGAVQPDRDVPRLFDLFSKAATPLDALLTRRYCLEEINEALADLEAGRVFRPLIAMSHAEAVAG